ncbi:MAG: hypothetical protein EA382_00945 [Spirochaetaceae bacterium]|nr:MAG: hypothetical protein EA382_00945 [Spirochaetaceae bacterium]
MKTTVDISRELLELVKEAASVRTNREAIDIALREYLRIQRSAELVSILGTFEEFMSTSELDRLRAES